ncbi:hypothetical protein SGL43_04535 [Streptomyces globisporus]|uniref:Uncharacterized protein n=1 Tax=Streptomyces globisporus TaxID=1908 RepID=A0ABM9H1L1_STRGL|nr:hypothetical protein SGL43_04535 [Streptomyces globisporus]
MGEPSDRPANGPRSPGHQRGGHTIIIADSSPVSVERRGFASEQGHPSGLFTERPRN